MKCWLRELIILSLLLLVLLMDLVLQIALLGLLRGCLSLMGLISDSLMHLYIDYTSIP